MKGRKRIPSHLKLVLGNRGRRPINMHEPKPNLALPDPPDHLSAAALVEWERVAPELFELGILTAIDRAVLSAYCQAYGRWVIAERALAQSADPSDMGGLTAVAATGRRTVHPLVRIASEAMRDVARYAAELGMTPSARSRVRAGPRPGTDPAAKYFD